MLFNFFSCTYGPLGGVCSIDFWIFGFKLIRVFLLASLPSSLLVSLLLFSIFASLSQCSISVGIAEDIFVEMGWSDSGREAVAKENLI